MWAGARQTAFEISGSFTSCESVSGDETIDLGGKIGEKSRLGGGKIGENVFGEKEEPKPQKSKY